jgi:hypothetical protein
MAAEPRGPMLTGLAGASTCTWLYAGVTVIARSTCTAANYPKLSYHIVARSCREEKPRRRPGTPIV